jgi:prophage tail gpP-like protein
MARAAILDLIVDGVGYRDIKRCSITRAFDQLADEVSIEMSDLWVEQRPALTFPFEEGDPFELRVDGEIWLTGIISTLDLSYSADSHVAQMTGMSWACNLTTSCHLAPRKWYDAPLDRIVRDVASPYGLDVSVQDGVDLGENFKQFGIGVGELSFEVIRRAAVRRGLWVTSDIESNLVICQAGRERMSHVIVGPRVPGRVQNVLEGRRMASFLDRHDEVIVVGQSGEHADWYDDQATHGVATAKDFGVEIYRPLVIHEPSESGATKLQRRADWEVRTRAGRARRLQYVVQGYLAEDERPGPVVWLPNVRVPVIDGLLDVDGELFIERASTDFTTEGTTTTLDLVLPQTYDLLAPPPKKNIQPRGRKGKWVSKWG